MLARIFFNLLAFKLMLVLVFLVNTDLVFSLLSCKMRPTSGAQRYYSIENKTETT